LRGVICRSLRIHPITVDIDTLTKPVSHARSEVLRGLAPVQSCKRCADLPPMVGGMNTTGQQRRLGNICDFVQHRADLPPTVRGLLPRSAKHLQHIAYIVDREGGIRWRYQIVATAKKSARLLQPS